MIYWEKQAVPESIGQQILYSGRYLLPCFGTIVSLTNESDALKARVKKKTVHFPQNNFIA